MDPREPGKERHVSADVPPMSFITWVILLVEYYQIDEVREKLFQEAEENKKHAHPPYYGA
jgi:hypothetical protein